jgi:hypothetical protein
MDTMDNYFNIALLCAFNFLTSQNFHQFHCDNLLLLLLSLLLFLIFDTSC